MQLKIHGHSDDLVLVTLDDKPLKDVYTSNEVQFVIEPQNGSGGVILRMSYKDKGLWVATIEQLDEDSPIPWPVRVGHYNAVGFRDGRPITTTYSVEVTIELNPDPFVVTIKRGRFGSEEIKVGEAA